MEYLMNMIHHCYTKSGGYRAVSADRCRCLNNERKHTTDIHLPRAIGEALHRAYKGSLDLRYTEESCFIEVKWSREQ
jgi:hypothetical protein